MLKIKRNHHLRKRKNSKKKINDNNASRKKLRQIKTINSRRKTTKIRRKI